MVHQPLKKVLVERGGVERNYLIFPTSTQGTSFETTVVARGEITTAGGDSRKLITFRKAGGALEVFSEGNKEVDSH